MPTKLFEPGNQLATGGRRIGSGGKPNAFKQALRKVLADPKTITEDDIKVMVDVAVAKAQAGNPMPLMQIYNMAYGIRSEEQDALDGARTRVEAAKLEREAIGVDRDRLALTREQTEFQLYFQQFCTSEQVKLLINQLYQAGLRTVQIINLETLREYAAMPNGDELLRQAIGQNLEKATTETILAIPAFGAPEQKTDADG